MYTRAFAVAGSCDCEAVAGGCPWSHQALTGWQPKHNQGVAQQAQAGDGIREAERELLNVTPGLVVMQQRWTGSRSKRRMSEEHSSIGYGPKELRQGFELLSGALLNNQAKRPAQCQTDIYQGFGHFSTQEENKRLVLSTLHSETCIILYVHSGVCAHTHTCTHTQWQSHTL